MPAKRTARTPAQSPARIAEERVVAATGKGWAHWFRVLDRFGCRKQGHAASARHLAETHDLSPWWSQTVTVAYEVAKGLREPSQRSGGKFGFDVQRTVAAPVSRCWEAFTTPAGLSGWFNDSVKVDLRVGGQYTGAGGDRCTYKRIDPQQLLRFTWEHPKHAPGSVVEVLFTSKGERTTVKVGHVGIATKAESDDLRAAWSSAMNDFRRFVERTPASPPASPPSRRPTKTAAPRPKR